MCQLYKPFVKRVGGKRQLLEQFQNIFPRSFGDHKTDHYYEPFLGGGAVFFNLRNLYGLSFKADLYDINSELVNTYKVVRDNPLGLINSLKGTYNKETFLEIKSRDQKSDYLNRYSELDRATRFIYLNRTCFNGMYRVNSKGFFNVPFGKYSNPKICDEENIISCSEALQNTNIHNSDFSSIVEFAKKGDFVYLDPPYDILSNTSNFTDYNQGGFGRDEQLRLGDIFRQLNQKGCFIMLSNHKTERIQNLYKDFKQITVKAKRMINSDATKRGAIEEIVILNYEK